jgi:membrane fusion protein (multidrug efflux system)
MSADPPDPEAKPPIPPRRRRRYLYFVVGIVVVVCVLAGVKYAEIHSLISYGKDRAAAGPPPEAVATDVAQGSDWGATLTSVGTVAGVESVAVSNDAPGIVAQILFDSGATARRGQVLVALDASPERAQLAAAVARRDNAELTAKRSQQLVDRDALPRAQLDADDAAYKAAEADVAAAQAAIDRKVVRAPFAGRLGIRAVNVGQYLAAGTTVTTLDSISGTYVDFTLPQDQLAGVAIGVPVQITAPNEVSVAGAINAVEPTIDTASRSLKLRATADDRDGKLKPGMFVTVAVMLPTQSHVVVVPATAVQHAPFGDSVFVVEPKPAGSPGPARMPDGKPVEVATQVFVRTGAARGDFVAVTTGVAAGQHVISAGGFKLRNGSPVYVDNTVKSKPALVPRVENR